MDVTSLLNSNAAAAAATDIAATEKHVKMEGMRNTPTRSRTPWDAGGYSLPINTIQQTPQLNQQPQQSQYENQYDDSQYMESQAPASPRHKFSDSRSSLSSFTSSLQSTTHSRYSSMSTVNSTLNHLDSLSPKHRNAPLQLELGTIDSAKDARTSTSLSPAGSLDTLALVAEHHILSKQPIRRSSEDIVTTVTKHTINHSPMQSAFSQGRPSSPSDAILIKRSAVPTLRVDTGDGELSRTGLPHNENFLSAPLNPLLPPHTKYTKCHQRSYSAPNLWPIMKNPDISKIEQGTSVSTASSSITLSPSDHIRVMNRTPVEIIGSSSTLHGPRAELTPPSSHHPDHPSPTAETKGYRAPDTPPATTLDSEAQVECMFVAACNTGSQLRKAISHIFGRNKLCTRQIPTNIWVHFCRKHYQRSRYRNPKEYAKLQCDLVQKQLRRIHEWSQENADAGRPGVVKDWELTIRKREQKRLDDLTINRKRKATAIEQEDDDNQDEEASTSTSNPSSHILTAVPQWLLDCVKRGYTTREILEIFNRLHSEILGDHITTFPDIEILPNFTSNQDSPKSPKGYAKRGTSSSSIHRRTQSSGAALQSSSSSPIGQVGQVSDWNDGFGYASPQQKRRRANDGSEEAQEERLIPRFRHGERQMDMGRRMLQLPHRPVFPDITENSREDCYGDANYGGAPAPHVLLHAPTPQRSAPHPMASQLETGNSPGVRRRLHTRSYSDVSGFGQVAFEYGAPQSGCGAEESRRFDVAQDRDCVGYAFQPTQYHQRQYHGETSASPSRWPTLNSSRNHGHHRHQSTPMAITHSSYPPAPASYGRQPPPSQDLHRSQRDDRHPFPSRRHSETGEAQSLYSARR